MFQSTHPHRVRPGLAVCCDSYIMFQSTHPHRVRLSTPMRKPRRLSFQSTHPHRVRLVSAAIYSAAPCFNPRTHIGCDLQYSSDLFVGTFQSTHPHRVRQHLLNFMIFFRQFQSTHPHRVRPCIQQMSEYHSTKLQFLRKSSK